LLTSRHKAVTFTSAIAGAAQAITSATAARMVAFCPPGSVEYIHMMFQFFLFRTFICDTHPLFASSFGGS